MKLLDKIAGSRILLALVAASGALNLAGEALWHRLASLLVGDWALTTTIVWSVFFAGSAAGAGGGWRGGRHLWLFEAMPAAWSLGWALAIRAGAMSWNLDTLHLAVIMLPPAIAMGAHIPAYAVLGGGRAGSSWSLWHLGGAAGIFALALLPLGSLSIQLALLALAQAGLAGLLYRVLRNAEESRCEPSSSTWLAPLAVGCFAASWMAAVLMQLSFLTLPLRIVGAAALAASALAASLGGVLTRFDGLRPYFAPAAVAAALVGILASGGATGLVLPQESPLLFGAAALALAMILMLPIAFTGAWYVARVGAGGDFGRILAIASVGNLMGFVGAYAFGMEATAVAGLLMVAVLAIEETCWKSALQKGILGLLALAFLAPEIVGSFRWEYRENGILAWQTWTVRERATIGRRDESWWALIEGHESDSGQAIHALTIHGAPSHDLASGFEYASPLIGGSYLPDGHARLSLVLGILSGQTSLAAAAFSDEVDAVDVSAASLDAVAALKDWNGDVGNNPKVRFIIEDGLKVLKACEPGSYDLIVNGASSPATAAGAKMFSGEAVTLAKRCLAPGGVYMSYLSTATAKSLEDADLLLRPIAHAFARVDIALKPYPLIIATDGNTNGGNAEVMEAMLRRAPAFAALAAAKAPSFFSLRDDVPAMVIPDIIRGYRPSDGPTPTLDNGLAERLAVPAYLMVWSGNGRKGRLAQDLIEAADAYRMEP